MTRAQSPLDKLRKVLDRFHDDTGLVNDVAESIESRDAAILFVGAMYDLLQDARAMYERATSRLIELTPRDDRFGPPIPIPGGGSIEFHGGSEVSRYRDNNRVLGKFAYEIGHDIAAEYEIARVVTVNGEDLTPNLDNIFYRVCKTIAEATGALTDGFKGWRATVAKQYGINLRELQERVEAPVTVTVRGRDPR